MTSHSKDEWPVDSSESFAILRYGQQITEGLDAGVHYYKLIDDLLKEAREIRMFIASGSSMKSPRGERKSLLGILRLVMGRTRREEPGRYFSLLRSRQIEILIEDILLVLQLAKQREKLCAKVRAQLEMQINTCHVEIERLTNQLQQHSATQQKTAQILLTKVADLHAFVASAKQYLDSVGDEP